MDLGKVESYITTERPKLTAEQRLYRDYFARLQKAYKLNPPEKQIAIEEARAFLTAGLEELHPKGGA